VPVTIVLVAAISALQMALEISWLTRASSGEIHELRPLLVAHAISAVVCAAVFTLIWYARQGSSRRPFLGYSERYLVGLGYGFVTSWIIGIAYGLLTAPSFPDAVERAGSYLYFALLTMELPVACVVGALTWHLISRARGGTHPPTRARRPIEDPE
jgi:hypothetical protein